MIRVLKIPLHFFPRGIAVNVLYGKAAPDVALDIEHADEIPDALQYMIKYCTAESVLRRKKGNLQ